MREELITFETAKLAKEKGFNWVSYFFEDNEIYYEYLCYEDCEIDVNRVILCPTQSLLQKWLREEHNIHIYVETYNNGILDFVPYVGIPKNRIMSFKTIEQDKTYLTYEEALEKGLQEALKLIEND